MYSIQQTIPFKWYSVAFGIPHGCERVEIEGCYSCLELDEFLCVSKVPGSSVKVLAGMVLLASSSSYHDDLETAKQ